jgi:predicted AAA+ superfamily ATPase
MLDITKLASELGVQRTKIYEYLEFLQGVFFVKLIPKFSKSIDRSVAAGRRVYFSDTGILNIIGKVNEAQVFENAIINQLEKYGEVSFFRLRSGAEIDAILNKEIALEIKTKATREYLTDLKKNCELIDVEKFFLVSNDYSDTPKTIFGLSL